MKFVNLTPHRMAALKALGRYQYLTLDQFLRLGISSNKSNLTNRVLIPLRDNKPALVNYVKRGAMKRDVYCLTKRGAQEVATQMNVESIRYPIDGVQFNRDFEHREGAIDFQIGLDQWSKQTETPIEFIHAYYIGTGSQKGKEKFKSQTDFILGNGDRFVPDLTFRMTMNDGESRLFAFEYHRGNDTGKILKQLLNHTMALQEGILSDHYRHPYANFVLSVYEQENVLKSMLERLDEVADFDAFAPCFLFGTIDGVSDNFPEPWFNWKGSEMPFFQD